MRFAVGLPQVPDDPSDGEGVEARLHRVANECPQPFANHGSLDPSVFPRVVSDRAAPECGSGRGGGWMDVDGRLGNELDRHLRLPVSAPSEARNRFIARSVFKKNDFAPRRKFQNPWGFPL